MEIARLEGRLVVVSEPVGVSAYDFDFSLHFRVDHPYAFDDAELCVLRIGAILDYDAEFAEKAVWGLRLVNDPAQHARASELEHWYPEITELTPRSRVYDELPSLPELRSEFEFPVFIKGSRQTSRHNPDLSIARDSAQYDRVRQLYAQDEILHWQRPVVREYVALESISGSVAGKVRPSVEFRTFWWFGECVGVGPYWYQLASYSSPDLSVGVAVAGVAAARLNIPFLVVDIARTTDGSWMIIECNDGQESGYAGVFAPTLWRNILEQQATRDAAD